jgi:hypothetical protein
MGRNKEGSKSNPAFIRYFLGEKTRQKKEANLRINRKRGSLVKERTRKAE